MHKLLRQCLIYINIKATTLVLILFFSWFYSTTVFAQDKRDYLWFFGDDQMIGPEVRALKFDFNKTPFTPELRDKGLNFDHNNVSICDKNGELLFYSNGCAIANREHEYMMNGDSINAGEFFDDFWFGGSCGTGYPGRQDILILQDPNYSDGFYVLHKRLERYTDDKFHPLSLSYSYVDLSLDGGLGAVTEKNIDFHTIDKFLWSYLTAIYHKNGRDWWIVNPGADSKFYIYNLDKQGLKLDHVQDAFHVFDPINASAGGDAKFSPDGTQFAYFNHTDGLLLYKFNRMSGRLSDVRKLSIPITTQASFATCEWSPNSEFLYLATGDSLWQVEVKHENLEDGKVFIAEHNGIRDPFSTRFFTSTLGPDCRIYIRPGSSSYSFHVIHKPNEKGVACDLVQQGIKLPEVSSTGSFPNYPRFRVDEEEKCDPSIISILGETVYWRRELSTYPNPVGELLTIELPEAEKGQLFIFDMLGQLVYNSEHIYTYSYGMNEVQLDLSDYASGTYQVEFIPDDNEERIIWTSKVVKQ